MKEDVEVINSYGPYNHSIWNYKGSIITSEEILTGRIEKILKVVREFILQNFTMDEIKNLTIADVGCYDGWILEQLSDLPFKRLVGIEPRKRNIIKGKMIRKHLGIESRIEWKEQSIEDLDDEKYDIVLCNGLMLHLEDHYKALKNLKRICKKYLFLETTVLKSKYIKKSMKHDLLMKDIAYFFYNKDFGISGHKYESSYYDGSTINNITVVNVPSLESLKMYLHVLGVHDYETHILRYKPLYEIYLWVNMGDIEEISEDALINKYESDQFNTLLDKKLVTSLYVHHVYGKKSLYSTLQLIKIKHFRNLFYHDKIENLIIKNLQYNPIEKITLEYAKILYKEHDYENAIPILKSITHRISADWRSVYRAFYLLHLIYKDLGDTKQSERYKKLSYTCNQRYHPC